jgi:thioredoxin 1
MNRNIFFCLLAATSLSLSGCWDFFKKDTAPSATAATEQDPELAKLMPEIATEQHFESITKESTKLLAIKFEAPWCSACKDLHPHFAQATKQGSPEFAFARFDVDKLTNIAQQLNIVGIPTILFFKNGKELVDSRIIGTRIGNDEITAAVLLAKMKLIDANSQPAPVTPPQEVVQQVAQPAAQVTAQAQP